jgi:hypothetical protein
LLFIPSQTHPKLKGFYKARANQINGISAGKQKCSAVMFL